MIVQWIPYSTFGGRRVCIGGAKPTLREKFGYTWGVPGGIKCHLALILGVKTKDKLTWLESILEARIL